LRIAVIVIISSVIDGGDLSLPVILN
jgi:hypothetical protein